MRRPGGPCMVAPSAVGGARPARVAPQRSIPQAALRAGDGVIRGFWRERYYRREGVFPESFAHALCWCGCTEALFKEAHACMYCI